MNRARGYLVSRRRLLLVALEVLAVVYILHLVRWIRPAQGDKRHGGDEPIRGTGTNPQQWACRTLSASSVTIDYMPFATVMKELYVPKSGKFKKVAYDVIMPGQKYQALMSATFMARTIWKALTALEMAVQVEAVINQTLRCYAMMVWDSRGGDSLQQLDHDSIQKHAYKAARCLQNLFRETELLTMLHSSELCKRIEVFPMAASKFNRFLLERQKRNIEPRSALSSQSMILIADTQRMPVLGMGTGYGDCFGEKSVSQQTHDFEDEGENDTSCSLQQQASQASLITKCLVTMRMGMVDTAFIYGTEKAIGPALRAAHVAGHEVFVVTKPMRSVWQAKVTKFAPFPHGFKLQLKWLDRKSVDMLVYHHPHDDQFEHESDAYWTTWRNMEEQVDNGHVIGLGHTNSPHWHQWHRYRHKPRVMEETWTPCRNIFEQHELVKTVQKFNVTWLGTSTLHGCQHDLLVKAVAAKLGVSSAQVLLRWSLQTGVPVIPQSESFEHMQQNANLFGFEIPELDMQLLSGVGTVYGLLQDIESRSRYPDIFGFQSMDESAKALISTSQQHRNK